MARLRLNKLMLFALSATVISLLSGMIGAASAIAHTVRFIPPEQPLILSRTLLRPISGDAEIRTKRTYEIQFTRSPSGYVIEGKLISAEIEAPARFEALAQIERSRPDANLFPIALDQWGQILPAEPHADEASVRAASQLASSLVPARLAPQEAQAAQAFIGTISANPVLTAWPADLFRPKPGKQNVVRTTSLPDGKLGQVVIEIEAAADSHTGLLSQLTRHVTTDIAGSQRSTIETWTLAAAAQP